MPCCANKKKDKNSLPVGDDSSLNSTSKQIAASTNNIAEQEKHGRVASWAVHFDRLLNDQLGVITFCEFLRREFSEENYHFWLACEEFKTATDDMRKKRVKEIYDRFLSPTASDPVNVDSSAKKHVEKNLEKASVMTFDLPQKQIYQLMKQDTYARFLKCDLYKQKVMDEIEGRTLDSVDSFKKKGVKSDRRRSIFPFPWNHLMKSLKTKTDSEMKSNTQTNDISTQQSNQRVNADIKSTSNPHNFNLVSKNMNVLKKESYQQNDEVVKASSVASSINSNNANIKKAPGPGIDLSTMRKEVFHPKESRDAPASHFKFCRIVMPDGSTTVVCAKPGQTSRSVLGKLCEKRSVSLAAMDVFLLGSDQPLDLGEDISTLGSKEIVIERRVLFRLDLPNGKSIGVKAKPNRSICDVFKPILQKYGHRMENVIVHLVDSILPLELDLAVSELDNKRVAVSEEGVLPAQKRRGAFFGLIRASEKRVTGSKRQPQEHQDEGQGKGHIFNAKE